MHKWGACFDWKCQKLTDSKYLDGIEKHSMDVEEKSPDNFWTKKDKTVDCGTVLGWLLTIRD